MNKKRKKREKRRENESITRPLVFDGGDETLKNVVETKGFDLFTLDSPLIAAWLRDDLRGAMSNLLGIHADRFSCRGRSSCWSLLRGEIAIEVTENARQGLDVVGVEVIDDVLKQSLRFFSVVCSAPTIVKHCEIAECVRVLRVKMNDDLVMSDGRSEIRSGGRLVARSLVKFSQLSCSTHRKCGLVVDRDEQTAEDEDEGFFVDLLDSF